VQTAEAHGYQTGDYVSVTSPHDGTQDTRFITVTGTTTFTLNGTVAAGYSYTGKGFVQLEVTANPSTRHGLASAQFYREEDGVFGWIGAADFPQEVCSFAVTFIDTGKVPDASETPPIEREVFAAGEYPEALNYHQQRLCYANTNLRPETILASVIGKFSNFTVHDEPRDADAVTFTVAGDRVARIRHLVQSRTLLLLTENGIWSVDGDGDGDGVLTPSTIGLSRQSHRGAGLARPVVIGESVLYVQSRGGVLRDLRYTQEGGGYGGRDLSIWSPHLLDGHSIVRMAFAEIPHSVLWCVRDDGVLLGMTYVPEQEAWGWHRHDTDGVVEDVQTLPIGGEDATFIIVRRTVTGETRRYVERLAPLIANDIRDVHHVDCGAIYDGRNTSDPALAGISMRLASGTNWDETEMVRLEASAAYAFTIGATYELDRQGSFIRCVCEVIVNGQVALVRPERKVPASFRNVDIATWSKCATTITGLSHLTAKPVSIIADGGVVSNGLDADAKVVTSGHTVTLDRPAAVAHIGLPYAGELETLDLENPEKPIFDRQKVVPRATLLVENFRTVSAGSAVDGDPGMREHKADPVPYGKLPTLAGAKRIEITFPAGWAKSSRVRVKHVDPLPLTVLSVAPAGAVGGGP